MIYSPMDPICDNGKIMTPPIDCHCKNFQQLNSELSFMKHYQKVSQSDLQAVKIRLGHL